MTVEESIMAVKEESQHFYSLADKGNSVVDSSGRRHLHSKGIINHKESSDEELIRRFMETQDEDAFNEIVNRYADKILWLALRITHDTSDADDVLQEVFLTMEKLNTFRGESQFSTWLHRVAANASYMHLRAKKKRCEKEVSFEDYVSYNESGAPEGVQIKDWSDKPDEVLLGKEAMEIIEKAASQLPVAYRVAFRLRDVEGFTNHEVAEVLGLSIECVATRVNRARLILRDKLSDYYYEWKK